MKKIALLTIFACSLLACTKQPGSEPVTPPAPGETGSLRLALAPESGITVVEEKSNETVNVNDFAIEIQDGAGASYAKYTSYSQVPAEVALPAGKYSIAATSGPLKSAAFDSPHYGGLKSFDVEIGKTVDVSVACAITNVKVTVEYSTTILTTLTDIKASVTSYYDAADNTKMGRLAFSPTETRAGWFAKPANKSMVVYVTGTNKQTGKPLSTSTTLSDVDARQWRKVKLDIKTSGGLDVSISVDETIIQKPPTDIQIPDSEDVIDNNGDDGNWEPGGEDPENPEPPVDNKPTIVGAAFGTAASSATFDMDKEVIFTVGEHDVLDVLMSSQSAAGISNLFLRIESEALKDVLGPVLGITGEIDLANPEAGSTWADMFADASLGILDPAVPIKGKTAHTFAVGKLMSLLGSVSEKGQSHKFHLRLVDANGEADKTLTIVLQ